jgi:hypothetical protein
MPKEHVAYIPLVYYWSVKPMDSKFWKLGRMKLRLGKYSYYMKLLINIGKGQCGPMNLHLYNMENPQLHLLYKWEAEVETRIKSLCNLATVLLLSWTPLFI